MSALDLFANPFFVLELDASATVVDVDRQGKRLLAELELAKKSARSFPSPFGRQPRDEARVRAAMATLRDPRLRAAYARFVPPRASWPADAGEAAVVDDAPTAGRAYPELRRVVPARRAWIRALLTSPPAPRSGGSG